METQSSTITISPGIHDNVPFRVYQNIDAVSNSYLGRLDQCPAKAKIRRKDTPTLAFGRAAHTYILEGVDAFDAEFAVSPQFDRRTKEGRLGYEHFQSSNLTKSILPEEDYRTIQRMNDAVRNHPTAKDLLVQGVSETTVIWRDNETDILCKGRPDWLPNNIHGVMVDLKTTRDASERAFSRSVIEYGYARQAAMYITGLFIAGNIEIDIFADIAVESEEPYRTEVYQLDTHFITWGYGEFKRLLRAEKECRDNEAWPHYKSPGATILDKPGYLVITDTMYDMED